MQPLQEAQNARVAFIFGAYLSMRWKVKFALKWGTKCSMKTSLKRKLITHGRLTETSLRSGKRNESDTHFPLLASINGCCFY